MESPEATASPSKEYGIRVEVEPKVRESRVLGAFDAADSDGKLSVVTVSEELHSTSMAGVDALSYSFDRQPAGILPPPKLWSLLAVFSGASLISIFGFSAVDPKFELGIPLWIYYLAGGLVFLLATAMQLRRVGDFLILSSAEAMLQSLEATYGKQSLIDLPAGRLGETKLKVEAVLKPLAPSQIRFGNAPLGLAVLKTESDKTGDIHG